MKRWRTPIAAAIVAAMLLGLTAAAYRVYAPGDLSDRIARAGKRWSIFTETSTWTFLGKGFGITLELAVVSIALSLVFAVGLALLRLSSHPRLHVSLPGVGVASRLAVLVIEIVRSSPLFLLIIYAYIALPKLGVKLSPFWSGVLALTLYTSCVLSEIVRAGILSLERGQFEAAEALGLSYVKRLRYVVLPQALRRMVPSIVSQLVTLLKDTSLVSFITVFELARRGQALQQFANNPIETAIVVMAMYFVVNFALSEFARRLERNPGRAGRAKPSAAVGLEDVAPVPA